MILIVNENRMKEDVVKMDFIKKWVMFGLGLAVTSKEQVEKFVDELVKKGELSLEDSKDIMDRWIQQKEERKEELQRIVREQLNQMIDKLGLATKEDIRKLEQQIRNLERRDE
jgi:polyhydroxyalkanoate synthesis regulator phasin